MINISSLRTKKAGVIAIGNHPQIIQSMLDFDYLQGLAEPSIKAIIANGHKFERLFFGKREIFIPVFPTSDAARRHVDPECINYFIALLSGRRTNEAVRETIEVFTHITTGTIFAEGVPERHAIELHEYLDKKHITVFGGSSVGLVIPGTVKLGAIGGVRPNQIEAARLNNTEGNVAVVSSSGGVVNELIRLVVSTGRAVSFACSVGGEYFPLTTPAEVFLAAEEDPQTKAIAYFGELGSMDEYEIASLIKRKKITKPVVAYIAGIVSELFETPPQFGHAKAMAASELESTSAKKQALRKAGVLVTDSFLELTSLIESLGLELIDDVPHQKNPVDLTSRQKGLLTSSISYNQNKDVYILGQDLISFTSKNSFAAIVMSMLLGEQITSPVTEKFVDTVLKVLVDHGPNVSGAVNTIISARAGKDLVSSLVSGLLTIGPRFGGAINESAKTWLTARANGTLPHNLVEEYARTKSYISGIGHKKYRHDLPDPRVKEIAQIVSSLPETPYFDYARAVEDETTQKKPNLILNVDGAIAAGCLDILIQEEGYTYDKLQQLVDQEFFNSLFVLSRSVGFMAHYFDQVRLDEGLFRLDDEHITHITL